MFPCCDYCYKQYINSDGSVDKERLQKIVTTDDKFKNDPCICSCHQDGIIVMH